MATWFVSTTGSDSNSGASSGSPFLTIGKAISSAATGDLIAIKTGTYVVTAALDIPSALTTLTLQGYQSTVGDGGTAPLITTATNSVNLFTTHSNGGIQTFDNLSLSNTATTRANGLVQLTAHGTTQWWVVKNCVFDGFTIGIDGNNVGTTFDLAFLMVANCEFKNCTSLGIDINAVRLTVNGCYFHDNATHLKTDSSAVSATLIRTLFTNGTVDPAINLGGTNCQIVLSNTTIANNTGKALVMTSFASYALLSNNLFYGNGSGITGASNNAFTASASASRNNAFGNNGVGNTSWNGSPGDVTLSADPFTNAAGGDYSLNSTAGGGAACKGAGFPGGFPGGLTTGSLDIGAAQGGAGGGGSIPSNYGWVS